MLYNYYTSVDLVLKLHQRKTYCVGTLRTNRKGNPLQVTFPKLKKSEVVVAFSSGGVCILKWKDQIDVLIISPEFGSSMIDGQRGRRGLVTPKSEIVVKYNASMAGNDHSDQMMDYCPIKRKSLKWYKKTRVHIFHLFIT